MTDIHDLIRAAWAYARANGREPDPDDEQEARNLADLDALISAWVVRDSMMPDAAMEYRFDRLREAVKDLRAEARLSAAAPRLLEASKGALRILKAVHISSGLHGNQIDRMEALDAAIAEAEGRP